MGSKTFPATPGASAEENQKKVTLYLLTENSFRTTEGRPKKLVRLIDDKFRAFIIQYWPNSENNNIPLEYFLED